MLMDQNWISSQHILTMESIHIIAGKGPFLHQMPHAI